MVADVVGGPQTPIAHQRIIIGQDFVQASNGMMIIQSMLPEPTGDRETGIECAVNGKAFIDFLNGINTESVHLVFESETNTLKVRGGDGKAKVKGNFVTSSLKDCGRIVVPDDNQPIAHDTQKLIGALAACGHVASPDKTQGALCGVKLDKSYVLATDRTRVVRGTMDSEMTVDCVVPVDFIKVVAKYKEYIGKLVLYDNYGLVAFGERLLIATTLCSDTYPDLHKYFQQIDDAPCRIVFGGGIEESIKRHSSMLKDVHHSERDTVFSIDGIICTISTTNATVGQLTDTLILREKVDTPVDFCINPMLLLKIISDDTEIMYSQSTKLITIVVDNFTYLIQTRR